MIPESNEVFTSYEAYLDRMDFYNQRRFMCEIAGRTGLTFFEAFKSEVGKISRSYIRLRRAGMKDANRLYVQASEIRELNDMFPDPLKGPILRKLQFSTTSRIDALSKIEYQVSSPSTLCNRANRFEFPSRRYLRCECDY